MHKLFVPRFEMQLANIHDWIEHVESKEVQLLKVAIPFEISKHLCNCVLQRMGFRDKRWTIPGANYGDWALVLDARYM